MSQQRADNRSPPGYPSNGYLLVIDEISSWRSVIKRLLGDQGYVVAEFGDLATAQVSLEGNIDVTHRPVGICLDLSFRVNDSLEEVERKFPPIDLFLNLIRYRFPDIPLVLVAEDEESTLRTANELNKRGLHAVCVSKHSASFAQELVDTAKAIFPPSHSSPRARTSSAEQDVRITTTLLLLFAFPFICLAISMAVRLLPQNLGIIGPVLLAVLGGFAFSLLCITLLAKMGILPPTVYRDCFVLVVKYLRPTHQNLSVDQRGERDADARRINL